MSIIHRITEGVKAAYQSLQGSKTYSWSHKEYDSSLIKGIAADYNLLVNNPGITGRPFSSSGAINYIAERRGIGCTAVENALYGRVLSSDRLTAPLKQQLLEKYNSGAMSVNQIAAYFSTPEQKIGRKHVYQILHELNNQGQKVYWKGSNKDGLDEAVQNHEPRTAGVLASEAIANIKSYIGRHKPHVSRRAAATAFAVVLAGAALTAAGTRAIEIIKGTTDRYFVHVYDPNTKDEKTIAASGQMPADESHAALSGGYISDDLSNRLTHKYEGDGINRAEISDVVASSESDQVSMPSRPEDISLAVPAAAIGFPGAAVLSRQASQQGSEVQKVPSRQVTLIKGTEKITVNFPGKTLAKF